MGNLSLQYLPQGELRWNRTKCSSAFDTAFEDPGRRTKAEFEGLDLLALDERLMLPCSENDQGRNTL
jgi:hypothetical protein